MTEIGLFDEVKTVNVVETVNGRRFVTDEETIEEMELAEASVALSAPAKNGAILAGIGRGQ